MFPTVQADGDTTTVTLDFPAEEYRCRECGNLLGDDGDGGVTSAVNGPLCSAYEPDGDDGAAPGEGPHAPERIPLSWCNYVNIVTDEGDDSVTVSFSVDDPRGAFTVAIRRVPDDSDSAFAGRLLLHAPHPDDGLPHTALTPLHPGAYLIGPRHPLRGR